MTTLSQCLRTQSCGWRSILAAICNALERSVVESRSRPLRAGLARRGIAIQGEQVARRNVVFCLFQIGHRLWVIQDGEGLESTLGIAPVQLQVLLGQKEDAVGRRALRRFRARRGRCIRPGLGEAGRSEIVGIGHGPSVPSGRTASGRRCRVCSASGSQRCRCSTRCPAMVRVRCGYARRIAKTNKNQP